MNEEKIISLLKAGYSISEIGKELEIDSKRLYPLAKKHNLPFNPPIRSGGPKERRIIRLHNSGFNAKDIGRIFSQSPINIEKIIKNWEQKKRK